MLTNIYAAFEHRDDADVYDTLATSVEGTLLKELYLHIKRSLIIAEQGGALSRATRLEVTDVKPAGGTNSQAYEVTWKLAAETEHWGHVHLRTSQYRARLTLSSKGQAMAIAKISNPGRAAVGL